jgi:beta-galactosidase
MIHDIVDGFAYGGDYNPEQWPEEVWAEDMHLMKEAGVNLVSVAIFSWARLQPTEDRFDFSWLDRVLDLLAANSIKVDLATATAAQPNWMSLKYPEVLAVDDKGVRYAWGSRQAYCPNSRVYRDAAAKIVGLMAERYARHPALAMWHVNNEYACHVDACYCDTCAVTFRNWLKERYGSLDNLNEAWGTSFWSQRYGDWNEVMPPRYTTTFKNPSQVIDYMRFMSDSILSLYTTERDILRAVNPEKKITTNFMPFFKPLDYWKWAAEIDVISWDSYPDPHDTISPSINAFDHDLMRSMGGGDPFMLMEQAPGRVNWRVVNGMKHPGLMRYHSFQAIAHGADAVMFFQWRQSQRGSEQFHSAMVPHAGKASRTYREISSLGAELKSLSDIAGSRIDAAAGIFVDYDSWWASELETAPTSAGSYAADLLLWYRGFRSKNIAVDMVSQNSALESYRLLVLPRLFLLIESLAERLEAWVASGGVLLVTGGSAWVDETGAIYPGGAPGPLKSMLGLHIADVDPLPPETAFKVDFGDGQPLEASDWREEIELEGAETLAVYSDGPLAGRSALTVNRLGTGEARYISFRPTPETLSRIYDPVLRISGIDPVAVTPPGVYATRRKGSDGRSWLFLMHEGTGEVEITLPEGSFQNPVDGRDIEKKLTLGEWGVTVLEDVGS